MKRNIEKLDESLSLSVYIISLLLSFTFYVLPRSLSTFYFLHYLVLVTGPRRPVPTFCRTLRVYMKRTPCCWPSRTKICQDPGLALQQIRLQSSSLLWEATSRSARSQVVPCFLWGDRGSENEWKGGSWFLFTCWFRKMPLYLYVFVSGLRPKKRSSSLFKSLFFNFSNKLTPKAAFRRPWWDREESFVPAAQRRWFPNSKAISSPAWSRWGQRERFTGRNQPVGFWRLLVLWSPVVYILCLYCGFDFTQGVLN